MTKPTVKAPGTTFQRSLLSNGRAKMHTVERHRDRVLVAPPSLVAVGCSNLATAGDSMAIYQVWALKLRRDGFEESV
jgi:hypothetical protein